MAPLPLRWNILTEGIFSTTVLIFLIIKIKTDFMKEYFMMYCICNPNSNLTYEGVLYYSKAVLVCLRTVQFTVYFRVSTVQYVHIYLSASYFSSNDFRTFLWSMVLINITSTYKLITYSTLKVLYEERIWAYHR